MGIDGIPVDTLLKMYNTLLLIRRAEEKIAAVYPEQEMRCPTHLHIGQEGISVGVCAHLRTDDWVFGGHRSHGPYLAKGGSLRKLLAELYGKVTGCTMGLGGSQHLAAPDIAMPGCSPIVGGTIPIGVGTAFATRRQGLDRVSVVFLGDAATEQGIFYESLNFAALKKLPVIFVCENNGLATHSWQHTRQARDNISERASIYGIPGLCGDGSDAIGVFNLVGPFIERARKGEGPALFEFKTYRWLGHVTPYSDEDKLYMRDIDINKWREKCPVKKFRGQLLAAGMLSEEAEEEMIRSIDRRIEAALETARADPFPEAELMERMVFKG